MAKRSRDDFEFPSPESTVTPETGEYIGLRSTASAGPNSGASSKIAHLDSVSGETPRLIEMKCSLPPHKQTISFTSYDEYDVHYAQTHVNRCAECRRNFPTAHFLNLHIEENHDSLVSVRRERGEKTYACFVEDCDRKCSNPQKRRMHLIDKHSFPKDYDFYVVNHGIDRRSSMLNSGRHRRRSSAAQHMTDLEERARRRASTTESFKAEAQPSKEEKEGGIEPPIAVASVSSSRDVDMDDLSGAMSALKFVPPSIRFGRGGRARGGFSRT